MSATQTVLEAPAPTPVEEILTTEQGPRRLIIAVCVAMGLVAIPYLFVLWDLWTGSINPVRSVGPSDFYELQANAIFHGHLYVPPGRMGVEAFIHDGHAYTYFGLFPSLIRMPIMGTLSALDGHLTAPSLLAAWIATGVFSALLLWRVRILLSGGTAKPLGWTEAISYGALVATITGGSVLMYLAANPWVYDEDLGWSVALTIGSLFCLLGVMEHPTWWRVAVSGVFVLCASLDRPTTGWACIIAALLVAGWFGIGRGGAEHRRWALPVMAVGLIALAIESTVNILKFGNPFSLPLASEVWTSINAHRRYFLAANGGKGIGLQFLPSTLNAYLNPAGLRLSSIFPFITTPAFSVQPVGHVVLDQTYPTASVTASMPLLLLLGIWGLVTAFRPQAVGRVRLARVLLVAAAIASGGVLLYGYIAERYLADLLPFLILGSVVGLTDLWRRAASRTRRFRVTFSLATVLLGIYCIAANTGIAMASMNSWTPGQATQFVDAQKALSIGSLAGSVQRGDTLPYLGPEEQLFDVNNCSGFYISTGFNYRNVPGQQLEHYTWIPIEQKTGINTNIDITLSKPAHQLQGSIPILKYGGTTVVVEPYGEKTLQVVVENPGSGSPAWPSALSGPFVATPHKTYRISVMTDPYLHQILIRLATINRLGGGTIPLTAGPSEGELLVTHYLAGTGPAVVLPSHHAPGTVPSVNVVAVKTPRSTMSLCHELTTHS